MNWEKRYRLAGALSFYYDMWKRLDGSTQNKLERAFCEAILPLRKEADEEQAEIDRDMDKLQAELQDKKHEENTTV